jgi:hypothetical protein
MLEICEKRCDQCLFTDNRIVSKTRMAEIIRDCRRNDTHFQCHKHTIAGADVMCRGFYETQPPSQMTRIAQRLGMVRFVALPEAV